MIKNRIAVMAAFTFLLASSMIWAQSGHEAGAGAVKPVFYVSDPVGRNAVTFKSQAPLEDIIGTTSEITGHIMFDPQHPNKGIHAQFAVPVASLKTGIPLRDEHLRGVDWFDAAQHPTIELVVDTIKKLDTVKATDASITFDAIVSGEFTIRGKKAPVEFKARVTYLRETEATQKRLPGDLLAIRAELELTLSDFGITGPKGMGIIGSKVGETIAVGVSIMGNTAAPDAK
ncbi:MAG: YceI family protein [Chitinivibrionia bacterium]|nr:YceI family protein [Chitinivibrionia bacterium]